jgi:hypothetical protein
MKVKEESQHQLGPQKEVLSDFANIKNNNMEWLMADAVDSIYDLFD